MTDFSIISNRRDTLLEQSIITVNDDSSSLRSVLPDNFQMNLLFYCIGLGHFWRLPYIVYSNGGADFLYIYLFLLFIIGIPLFYLEIISGQLLQLSTDYLGAFNKKLKGVNLSGLFVSFIVSLYLSVIFTWSFYYLVLSFYYPLPWEYNYEVEKESSPDLKSEDNNDYVLDYGLLDKYFKQIIMRDSRIMVQLGSIHPRLLIIMLFCFILLYISMIKGLGRISKYPKIMFMMILTLIAIFIIRSLFLEGSLDGLAYLFLPQYKQMFMLKTWVNAGSQVIFTLGLGFGHIQIISSLRKENNEIRSTVLYISLASIFFGLLILILTFSTLGYFSFISLTPINQLTSNPINMFYVVFSGIVSMTPFSNLPSVLFFSCVVYFQFYTMFILGEVITEVLHISINKYFSRKTVSISVLVISLALSVPFATNGGLYLIKFVDKFSSEFTLVVVLFIELIIISRYIGMKNLNEFVFRKTDEYIPEWVIFNLRITCPITLFLLILGSLDYLIQGKRDEDSIFPFVFELICCFVPLVLIVLFYVKYKNSVPNEERIQLIQKEIDDLSRKTVLL